MTYDHDLFVIGAGSGGVRTARMSGGMGARVAICEDAELGGTCVNVGCVPKKLLVYGSGFAGDFEDAAGFGWSGLTPRHDWAALIEAKNREVGRLNKIYEGLLERTGVELLRGRGRLVDAHTVEVGGERRTAERILVAVGGRPWTPPIPGIEHAITSNEAFFLPELPRRVVVVGGGYIGVEFAGIFDGLGSEVTVVHRGEGLLRGFDADVSRRLGEAMVARGISLRLGDGVASLAVEGEERRVTLRSGEVLRADVVLFATGRVPRTEGLGLEAAGVETDANGAILVNDLFESSAPSVLAIGDVIDRVNLTPVATAQGTLLARRLFAGGQGVMDYDGIPTAVFSQPPLGTVGLTEAAARESHTVDVYEAGFRPMKNTISGREERTYMKLVVDRESDRVLGCHMLGPDAGETIQGLAVALKAGATKAQFDATIGIHPTAAEEFVTMRTPRSEEA